MKKLIMLILSIFIIQLLVVSCDDNNSTNSSITRPEGRLYILNQADNTIHIYDTQTLMLTDSFSSVVEEPHFIEFSHDGLYFYVISRRVGGLIAKFRASDNSLITTVPTQAFPTALAIDNNDIAYVSDFTLAKGKIRRYDVSGENFTFIDSNLQAGFQTHDIRGSSDGRFIVSAGFGSDDLVIYEPAVDNLIPITLDSATQGFNPASNNYGPYGIQIDHNGTMAFIACRKGVDQIRIIDLVNKTIVDSIITPVSNLINPDANGPTYMDLSPDNNILYVTNFLDNSVSIVRISTREVLKKISFEIPKPFSLYLNDLGTHLYVSCTNTRPAKGMVYVIETENYTKVDSFSVGSEPFGFDWRPAP